MIIFIPMIWKLLKLVTIDVSKLKIVINSSIPFLISAVKQENEVQTPSYRLQTKGNQWVWVATHFIVAGNRQTRKPEKIIGKYALCSAHQVKHENREIFSRPVSMLPDGNDDVPTSDKDTHTSFMSPQSFHSPAPFWDSNHHMQNINKNMVTELDNLIIFCLYFESSTKSY